MQLVGLAALSILVAGAGKDSPHWAIHPPDRTFTSRDVASILGQARSQGAFSDLVRRLADNPDQLKSAARLAQTLMKLAPEDMPLDASRLPPQVRQAAEKMLQNPQFRRAAEQMLQDDELRERLMKDARLRSLAEEIAGQSGRRAGSRARSAAKDRNPTDGEGGSAAGSRSDRYREMFQRFREQGERLFGGGGSRDSRGDRTRERANRKTGRAASSGSSGASDGWLGGKATEKSRGFLTENVLKVAKKLRGSHSPLSQTPGLASMIEKLESASSRSAGRSGPPLSWAPSRLQGLGAGVRDAAKSINERTAGIRRWSGRVARQVGSKLPSPRLSGLPSIPAPSFSVPKPPTPRLSIPRFSLSMGDVEGLAWFAGALVGVLACVAVLVAGAIWLRPTVRRIAAERAGRRELESDRGSNRQRIRRAFECLAFAVMGEPAAARHHRQIAREVGKEDRLVAASEFADLYELARYSPPSEPIDSEAVRMALLRYRELAPGGWPRFGHSDGEGANA